MRAHPVGCRFASIPWGQDLGSSCLSVQITIEFHRGVGFSSIHLRGAFDQVHHQKLLRALQEQRVPTESLWLGRRFHNNDSDSFRVQCGKRRCSQHIMTDNVWATLWETWQADVLDCLAQSNKLDACPLLAVLWLSWSPANVKEVGISAIGWPSWLGAVGISACARP